MLNTSLPSRHSGQCCGVVSPTRHHSPSTGPASTTSLREQGLRAGLQRDEVLRVGPDPARLCPYKKGQLGHGDTHTGRCHVTLETVIYRPRRASQDRSYLTVSEGASPADQPISDFQPPGLGGNKVLLSSRPVWGPLIQKVQEASVSRETRGPAAPPPLPGPLCPLVAGTRGRGGREAHVAFLCPRVTWIWLESGFWLSGPGAGPSFLPAPGRGERRSEEQGFPARMLDSLPFTLAR